MASPATILDCLLEQSRRKPDARAFLFLPDGEAEGDQLTYAALAARTAGLAARLEAEGLAGERVLLLYPPGLDFIVGFLACLAAGVVAVPVALPDGQAAGARVGAIAADCGATVALTTDDALGLLNRLKALSGLRLLVAGQETAELKPVPWRPDDLAFLQYTSGSTSSPRGVMLTHANAMANQRAIHAAAEQHAGSVFLGWLPLFHDMGLMGLVLQPIYLGATCVLMPPRAFLHRPASWLRAISRYRATLSGGPNFAFDLCLDRIPAAEREGLDLSSWEVAYSGAEPVSASTMARFVEAFAPHGLAPESLYPCYGLAEATAFYTGGPRAGVRVLGVDAEALQAGRVEPGDKPLVGCGVAHDDHQVRIVDPVTGLPAAPGRVGEVWLAGGSVGVGYWNRPDATREVFGHRLPGDDRAYLRTGDLGVLDGDALVVCGRLKDLLIVRGRNHHPHDVERTVRTVDPVLALGEGAAFTVPGPDGERVCIVHELRPAARDRAAELFVGVRGAIAAAHGLDVHDIVLIKLGSLPKTTSGKVQRAACRAAYLAGELEVVTHERLVPAVAVEPPLPGTETRLAALWSAVLGRPVGRHQDFFALGGHSLAAMRLGALVQDEFEVELGLGALVEAPTVAALAALIEAASPVEAWPTLVPDPDRAHEPFPLNPIQLAYWLGREAAFGLGQVATHVYVELDFPALDLDRLTQALTLLAARHAMLRARILPGHQQRIEPASAPTLRVGDPDALRAEMSHQVLPGDAPMFDLRASRLPDGRTRLHASVDALIADAWSLRALARELGELYLDPTPRPVPGVSFRDYVLAEAALRGTARHERERAWWAERLPALPPAPDLPLAVDPSKLGTPTFHRRTARLAPADWRRLRERATQAGLTATSVLLAAYALVVGRWSQRADFTLNVTHFQRLPLHPDVERVAGDFTSLTLLAVTRPQPEGFRAFARRLQAGLWEALDHRLVSGVELLRELARHDDRATAAMPIVFTSTLADDERGLTLPAGVELAYAVSQTPQVHLDHQVHLLDGALVTSWDAVDGLFPAGMLDAMWTAYHAFVARLASDDAAWEAVPDVLPLAERAAWDDFNDTAGTVEPLRLHDLFEARRRQRPTATAVIAGELRLDYETLGRRADALAGRLGVGVGERVAIALPKGHEQVVAALAVLKTGAAYVPVDPHLPPLRLRHILDHAGVSRILTLPGLPLEDPRRLDVTPEVLNGEPRLADPAQPTDLAYVIYTSGSTGTPKGVMIDHQAAVNTILDVNRRFGVRPGDRVLALSALGFDLSVYDLFGVLGAGGTLVMPEPGLAPDRWLALVREHGVTLWNTVPALAELLVEAAERARTTLPLRRALLSGDWIPLSLPDRLRAVAPDCAVTSLGGATEASIWSNFYEVGAVDPAWRSVPYGRPLAGQTLHVLDELGMPAPTHVRGRLYIGGVGVALGYWGDPERTRERFQDGRYHTGDLARLLPDGQLEFLGREDFQVKIGGHRIELGEIEAALASHPAVKAVVVAPDGPARAAHRLLAYVVGEAEEAELRRHAAERLPAYMVPARVLMLTALPLSANGKVDRSRLPAPDRVAREKATPRTAMEILVAGLWAEVLGLDAVYRDDHFFALGGHSLTAVRFLTRLREATGHALTLAGLFETPTLAALAAALERSAPLSAPGEAAATGPLSFSQERLWFLSLLAPGSAQYHLPAAVRLAEDPDLPRLTEALRGVIARHDLLRTAFVERDGLPLAVVQAPLAPAIEVFDTTGPLEEAIRKELQRPFDLGAAPLLRLTLLRDAGGPVLVLTMHHLVSDGWSQGLFFEELGALYRGESLPPLATQFADHVRWEREAMEGDRLDSHLAYWRARLAGQLPIHHLPADRPRQPGLSDAGATATFYVPPSRVAALTDYGRPRGATLFMVMLAAFKAWLHRATGDGDLLVGVPVTNRMRPGAEALVGLFVDTVAMRVDATDGPDFEGLLARVQEATLGAFAHQDVPLQALTAALRPERDGSGVPVVRVGFGLQYTPLPNLALDGHPGTPLPVVTGTTKADFSMLFWEEHGGLRGAVEYRSALFDPDTIEGFIAAYEAVLAEIAEAPGTLRLAAGTLTARPTVAARTYVAPRTRTEQQLVALWEDLFDHRPIGIADDFFQLGGHSLMAVRLVSRVRAELGRELPLASLFEEATIEALAGAIDRAGSQDVLVTLKAGDGPPCVLVHPIGGDVFGYRDLVAAMDRPVYAFQAPGLLGREAPPTLAGLAALYVDRLVEALPAPYHLAGWSMGGLVAHAMATELQARGLEVASLTLIDAWLPADDGVAAPLSGAELLGRFADDVAALRGVEVPEALRRLDRPDQPWLEAAHAAGLFPPEVGLEYVTGWLAVFETHVALMAGFTPRVYTGDAHYFQAQGTPDAVPAAWRPFVQGHWQVERLAGDHHAAMKAPLVGRLAAHLMGGVHA